MKRLWKTIILTTGLLMGSSLIISDQIQPLLDIGEKRQKAEKTSQAKIDQMDDDTSLIVNEFKTVSRCAGFNVKKFYKKKAYTLKKITLNKLKN